MYEGPRISAAVCMSRTIENEQEQMRDQEIA